MKEQDIQKTQEQEIQELNEEALDDVSGGAAQYSIAEASASERELKRSWP